ncbi:MAG: PD-(D/E)XK nuclease domain-containing protein [Amoebophilaceae bacterium]|nr:PD-(D/E)XK nuclease domain-containing protein [Amoebophilaceae bacterium]
MLFAGYLKADTSQLTADDIFYECEVRIPNNEVRRLYNSFFKELFMGSCLDTTQYASFLNHLIDDNVSLFSRDLTIYLLHTVSAFDTKSSKKSEGFYHGFVLAMLASINDRYYIRSNRESGYGRYEVLLIPKEGPKALLLEFKQVGKEEELENAAKLALDQIQGQFYHTELLQYPHVQEVVEVGMAFSRKEVIAAYSVYDLVNNQATPVQLTSRYSEEDIDVIY